MAKIYKIALIFLFFGLLPVAAEAATLYFSPSAESYTVGSAFSISVYVSSADQAMNAADGVISFPPDKLEIISLSKAGSIFNFWVQEPRFSNSFGTAEFEGIVLEGFKGSAGKIITLNFRVKAAGTAPLSFSSGSILAYDGKGTNILSSMVDGNYTLQPKVITPSAPEPEIKPPAEKPKPEEKPSISVGVLPSAPIISSSTHPDENKWYKNNSPQFSWDLPADVTGVSFKFDKSSGTIPGNVSDGLFSTKIFKDVADGIWYFHLKFKNKTGWGKVSHYKVQIDTTPPEPFEIKIQEGKETTNPTPTLLFDAKDKTSGIEYYEVKIGEGDIFPIELEDIKHNPFKLSPQAPGSHTIIVKAVDKAGNSTLAMEEVKILSIEPPKITEYPRTIESGQIITLQGTSLPKCLISIYYQEEEEVLKLITKANSSGFWEYIFTKPLKEGIYRFWAEAMDENGAMSSPSERITIRVQPPIFLRVGKLAIDYLTTIITILILIFAMIFGLFWSWQKAKKYRASLKKETKEAEESLKKAMIVLREEISEKLKSLEKVKSSREFTEEEKRIEKELKENLDIAEKYIEKEIKDIEEKIR